MKTWTIAICGGLTLVALPFAGGCVQESANSAPAIYVAETNGADPADDPAETVTGVPAPEQAVQDLETAPAKLVSTPPPPSKTADLNAASAEVAKLAESGVDENVMMAFVTNSPHTFNLSADQIVYLNDIGVSSDVVAAMIQHDQMMIASSSPPPQSEPAYSNPQPAEPETTQSETAAVEAPLTPPASEVNQNVTYTYFYDSLAPYGNWIDIEGYGRCWQPTVVVADRGWTPYATRGHWVYTDAGWFWDSDYSWGWAPFHYGRWFHHRVWGWCWAPDTVWGPAWVSWRYSPGYCGWAPLPPCAYYRSGFGFTYYGRPVGASFSFGLGIGAFTFVASDHFCDPHPWRHRVPHDDVTRIFHHTTIINPVAEGREHPHLHKGIPPREIASATHTEIKPVRIHETPTRPSGPRGNHFNPGRGTLTVFRPNLPEPPSHRAEARVGEGIKPATPHTAVPNFRAETERGIPRQIERPNRPGQEQRSREPFGIAARQTEPGRDRGLNRNEQDRVSAIERGRGANPGSRENHVQATAPQPSRPESRSSQIIRGGDAVSRSEARSTPNTTTQPSRSTPRLTEPQRNGLLLNRRQQELGSQPESPSHPLLPPRQIQPNTGLQRQERIFRQQETPRFQLPQRNQQSEQRIVTPAPDVRQQTAPSAPAIQRQMEPRIIQRPSTPAFTPGPRPSAPVISPRPDSTPHVQAPKSAPARQDNGGGRQWGGNGGNQGQAHRGGR